MSARLLLALGLGLFLAASGSGADQSSPSPPLPQLIKQLGSARFKEREEATRLLRASGPEALPLLRQAARGGDLEVRRRAQALLEELERLENTRRLLTPQKIRLSFRDTPLGEAVAELARKTGWSITLEEKQQAELAKRKITLETGEISHWEALERFCAVARLREEPPPAPRVEDVAELLGERRRVIWVDQNHTREETTEPRFVLRAGQSSSPTYRAGALRIQTVGIPVLHLGTGKLDLTLAVATEARLRWHRLLYLRVDSALTGEGHRCKVGTPFIGNAPAVVGTGQEVIILWDGFTEWPYQNRVQQGTVSLTVPPRHTTRLKQVTGVVGAQIETAPEPLVRVDRVMKSAERTVKGEDGTEITITSAQAESDGQYVLQVAVRRPPRATDPPTGPGVRLMRVNRRRARQAEPILLSREDAEKHGLALLDSKDKPLKFVTGELARPTLNGFLEYTLYFQAEKDQGDPATLVYSGRRLVSVEVPFTLTNIPVE